MDLALVDNDTLYNTSGVLFTVQNADGDVRCTRNGNFTVDTEGFITTNEGYYVRNQAGNPIQTNGLEFTVTANGVVQVDGINALF
ncbi:hypothetical protein [Pseudogracilibacillus sp. SO30301A]|uniref:hypothetical protein n=1 Tax=Pseudogracilibacillus sp. SO30301A TaxID=3098291 RepID=UPI00300DBFF1